MELYATVGSVSIWSDFCANSSNSRKVTRSSKTSTFICMSVENWASLLAIGSFILWKFCRRKAAFTLFSEPLFPCSKRLHGGLSGLSSSVSSVSGTSGRWFSLHTRDQGVNDPVHDLVWGCINRATLVSCYCSCARACCSVCGAAYYDALVFNILCVLGMDTICRAAWRKRTCRNRERSGGPPL